MQEQIDTFRDAMPNLADRDREFAQSLLDQWSRRGLSDRQRPWITRLIERATKPAPEPMQIGSIEPIVALIQQAKSRLKFPSILLGDGETELRVSVAGSMSKCPGAINVTSIERDADGRRSWFGRIQPTGQFEPAMKLSKTEGEKIGAMLWSCFAEDPASVALWRAPRHHAGIVASAI